VASVTEEGYVIANQAGTTTITVETEDGGYQAKTTVTVSDELQQGREEYTNANRHNPRNPPAAAINHEYGEAWSPGSPTGSNSWWIDLGQNAEIDGINMKFWAQQKYKIEVSEDGKDYHQIIDRTDNLSESEYVSDTLPEGTIGRYIRVTITEASQEGGINWQSIEDFVVKGKFILQSDEIVLSETDKTV